MCPSTFTQTLHISKVLLLYLSTFIFCIYLIALFTSYYADYPLLQSHTAFNIDAFEYKIYRF